MNYDTLCLSSGGVYGIAYIGAIDYLIGEKIIELSKIKKYVGTSVGALISYLLIIGYSIKDVNDIIINLNFNKLQTDIDINKILENFGINNGSKFSYMIKFFLKKKLNLDDITFNELYKKTNINFIIIGTNFNKGEEVVFNYINTPDMSILLALRISVSIPIIFTPVLYNNEYYVDGGLSNAFPINHCNEETTISINIICNKEFKINSIIDVFLDSINILTKTIACKHKYYREDNVINIYNDGSVCNFFNLDFTLEDKHKLLDLGREYTIKHINNTNLHIRNICKNILNEIIDTILITK